jgi:hypothetical protein
MSDAIPLKVCLNKQGHKYKYIKLSELEINKKYEVTAFEIINTNQNKKISVILDNKYKLFLPNRYLNIISENLYEMNDFEWNTFYIYYRYEKMFDNGDVYHHLEFEADILNDFINKLLKELNTEVLTFKYIQFSDLNINEKNKITSFKKINTKYGKRISILLNNIHILLLPYRYVNTISKQDIDQYNGEMYIIYKGKKLLDNGKSIHLIEFE